MYIHCSNCNWEQDDFWSIKGYNPIKFMVMEIVPCLIKPRMIDFSFITGARMKREHSWKILLKAIWTDIIKEPFHQKWWTINQYNNSNKRCPKCGWGTVID